MNDFTGFTFNHIHSADLHLIVCSSSDRYDKNLLPNNKDYSVEVPGGNGEYYFGSTFQKREFQIDVAFDSVDEKTWRKISNLFATDKLCDLIFDELPYKTYRAKIAKNPEFKFICFMNRDTGERVYKGEGTLNFICYFPFAFGFNKYIIRAADNYLLEVPKLPNYDDKFENPYDKKKQKIPNLDTKEFYNVKNNMNTPWKGGYPTIEQVRAGELYFNSPDGKKLIDVRNYFRNVPEWAESSKLLVTPTLDYDQDLIFLPQYSKTNYINMDTGLNNENALIGSRLLVYNPGDLPIDYEIKLDNNEKTFWMERGNHFEIRRFNVQRLPIPAAVDWTGLKTQDVADNISFKYGNKYFKTEKYNTVIDPDGLQWVDVTYEELNEKHPDHAFIAEPIARQRLGHFIRLFYWQSSLRGNPYLDFEEGIKIADRYEELLGLCIDEMEEYELYWKTLKEAILDKYKETELFQNDLTEKDFEDFVYNFIHTPPEFIRRNPKLYFDQFDFNLTVMPQWISEDYYDINTQEIEKATLFLDSEKRMLYNVINPEYNQEKVETLSNFYKYKPSKKIYNDNIEKGHWFKIPPGWSLIEITPICKEDEWGGKRWLDSRPFDWGYGGDANGEKLVIQKTFDRVYKKAEKAFLKRHSELKSLNFRKLHDQQILEATEIGDNFSKEYYLTKQISYEYEFLKLIHSYWRAQKGIGKIKGTIEEWWWYACNYIWALFPPLYWGYADILNKAKIKYIPLFY